MEKLALSVCLNKNGVSRVTWSQHASVIHGRRKLFVELEILHLLNSNFSRFLTFSDPDIVNKVMYYTFIEFVLEN